MLTHIAAGADNFLLRADEGTLARCAARSTALSSGYLSPIKSMLTHIAAGVETISSMKVRSHAALLAAQRYVQACPLPPFC